MNNNFINFEQIPLSFVYHNCYKPFNQQKGKEMDRNKEEKDGNKKKERV